MKKFFGFTLAAALLAASFTMTGCQSRETCATYQGSGKVIANLNGNKITEDKLKLLIQSLPPQSQQQFQSKDGQKKLLDQLTTQTLLVQEAKRLKLNKDPIFLVRRELMSNEILLNRYYQYIVENNPATDAELKKFYQTHPDIMAGKIKYTAKHIIITPKKDMKVFNSTGTDATTDAAAMKEIKMIQKKLAKGADFSELAKKYSEGPSASRGGDLGTFEKGTMVPEFEQALAKMKPGEISGIVKTRFGYHLVKLVNKTNGQRPPFDQLTQKEKQQLKGDYYRSILTAEVEKLKKQAAIKIQL
ncbi:MAG: hypothetical protein GXO69_03545 [Acidobacteria bacterium]|nr:hypothetical protein [Acidobacteriota bacterium]